jgi:ferredoxin
LNKKKEGNTSFGSMTRREFLGTVLSGAAISVIGFGLDRTRFRAHKDVIRPPGAVEEEAFLSLCSRCGRCVVVCPNSALHLQGLGNGLANFLTPALVSSVGYCILAVDGCRSCMDACPTKALCPIDFSGVPSEHLSNLLKIGTAVLDTDKCIPYTLKQSCLACIEICPVDRVITMKGEEEPRQPVFDEELCFGCGACENVCPAIPKAVSMTSAGAKRVRCWEKV